MRIISRKRIAAFGRKHPDALASLEAWHAIVRAARWQSLQDARRIFPHADAVLVASGRIVTVFNIAGNKYRLLAALHYNRGVAFALEILKHAEYDRGRWKERL
jgi:mRNA interferase HigB